MIDIFKQHNIPLTSELVTRRSRSEGINSNKILEQN